MAHPSNASPTTLLARLQARIQTWAARAGVTRRAWESWTGYVLAVAGVAVASLVIALVQLRVRISNISLVYLLVVLWLAAVYGRGPAILASVLAFLAYDYFFIEPLHTFTVANPAEWLSLSALLMTSLVIGQLTAMVRARAEEARQSQRRTATLYALAQTIVRTADQERLDAALVAQVVEVFGAQGVRAASLVLRGPDGHARTQAITDPDTAFARVLSLEWKENAASALYALEKGSPVGGMPGKTFDLPDLRVYFVPLTSGRHITGALGIAGTPAMRNLLPVQPLERTLATVVASPERQQQTLFAAFCSQIALALDRAALRREAIHAEALRESDQLKDVLLGSVTHDLRTPLASIKAATSSLLQSDAAWSATERREFIETIDISADRLNRLVGNLLDLSRLEAGVAQPRKDWYLIGEVIATVLDRLDLTGATRAHHVAVDLPDDMPLVPMDYGQIEQVLTNLLENAFKYSPEVSTVTVSARVTDAGALEVRVRDQGIGIPPGELEAIFDKFYRVQHVQLPWMPARPPVGTGLGLAICAGIVQVHGGRIWAESEPGHGATFVFTLPVPVDRPRGRLPELDERTPTSPEAVDGAEHAAGGST